MTNNTTRRWRAAAIAGLITAASLTAATPAAAGAGRPACRGHEVPVKMTPTDTTTYRVYAELCTRGRPDARTPVQVLLHGGTYDHAYWDWPYRPNRYSYVEHATRRGFATFNIDRLGYGRSDRPDPNALDFRVAGYVTHQVVRYLRARAGFTTVVLNGHSMGGITAEHAMAYGGVDAVIISGLARDRGGSGGGGGPDPTFHPAGRDPKFAGKPWPAGYLTTIPNTRAELFLKGGDYEPAIVRHEEALKDTLTVAELRGVGQPDTGSRAAHSIPTLYVLGQYDRIACRTTGDCRTDPAAATTDRIIGRSGHSINMSRHAAEFYRVTFDWLRDTGIG